MNKETGIIKDNSSLQLVGSLWNRLPKIIGDKYHWKQLRNNVEAQGKADAGISSKMRSKWRNSACQAGSEEGIEQLTF